MTRQLRVSLHRGELDGWQEIRDRVISLERAEWGPVAFTEPEIARQFLAPNAVNALLYDGQRLVGFACSAPLRARLRTTYLWNILVDPLYRGRGLVSKLMTALERELRQRGYEYLEMDAQVDNGFADAVERHYRKRATVTGSDHDSPYGSQRPIRVSLIRRSPVQQGGRRGDKNRAVA